MMISKKLPALWLLVLIVGLPQLSETVYTPALPEIAQALNTPDSWVEFTLTIYLLGFAFGTLSWGYLSDRFGRKPCLLSGLLLYILGCLGCFFANSIEALLCARFIQALGGSTGSVLGQAICREAFSGTQRGRVFATIGSALSLAPAIGPVLGGTITQYFGWATIFLVLIGFGFLIFALVTHKLPETNQTKGKKDISIPAIWKALLGDKRVMGFCLLIGLGNGLTFSYYAEGSFFLIDMLNLSPSSYGASFFLIAVSSLFAGMWGRWLHKFHTGFRILEYGLALIFLGTTVFTGCTLAMLALDMESYHLVLATLACMSIIMMGLTLAMMSCLSLALESYQSVIGTASSLFGFMYYCVVSLITLSMSALHDNTLIPMPVFFTSISITMIGIYLSMVRQQDKVVAA